jgi:hypothetical protein
VRDREESETERSTFPEFELEYGILEIKSDSCGGRIRSGIEPNSIAYTGGEGGGRGIGLGGEGRELIDKKADYLIS